MMAAGAFYIFMCGIHGIISPKPDPGGIAEKLSRMGDLQCHRGPDDRRNSVFEYRRKQVGMGFVRLAILDLETGMQPIRARDGTSIICNGQIYNYVELREMVKTEPFVSRGDVEVALHLYRKLGLDFLHYLNGMYAGAIFDPRRHRMILFRDRFGIKPVYYTHADEDFLFSSEIKPLLEMSGKKAVLNRKRLPAYFTYRYVPGGETLFEGVHRLPPGSFLVYDLAKDTCKVRRYWEYRLDRMDPGISIRDAADRFAELFADAVRIRLRSDVEVGTLISGGIDSSAVSVQAALLRHRIRLFTIAFEEEKYNELPHVNALLSHHSTVFDRSALHVGYCRKSHLDTLPGIIRSLEEPISLGTLLPTDQVCALAARQVKVVLTGEGADEIFAGYRKFMIEAAAAHYDRLPEATQKRLTDAYPELCRYAANRAPDPKDRYIQTERLFSEAEIELLTGIRRKGNLFPPDARPHLKGTESDLNAAIAFESRFRLPDYVNLRLDRLSMRHSLEARTPLLDYRLAEFAATLPDMMKANIEADREKYICRYAYLTSGLLDAATVNRRKQPFTIPMADWLADPSDLPEFVKEIIFGNLIKDQGIIDPVFARQLFEEVEADRVGPETLVSAADRAFSIIIFTLWHHEFFN